LTEDLPHKTDLSNQDVSDMQRLEREMGVILLAWYKQPMQFAKLNDEQVEKLRKLEESLDTTIIAYKPPEK
jgi:hypothetical protein